MFDVYITKASKFLPNKVISNDEMESYLGLINKTVSKVKYTWWGGVLGPRLLHHTKCEDCRSTFNSKTGKSNTPGIVIYSLVIFAVAFALFFFIRTM